MLSGPIMLSDQFLLSAGWYDILAALIAADDAAKANVLFDSFSAILRSDEVMLFHFRRDVLPSIIEHRTMRDERRQQIAEYRNGFYLIDPFFLSIERATRSGAISLREVVDEESFGHSEFYRRHYSDTGLVDELCYCLSDGDGGHLLLSFARYGRAGRYSAADIAHAKTVAPVVLATLASSWRSIATPGALMPPTSADVQLHLDLRRARSNFGRSALTDREFEVVQMLLRGYPLDVISTRLGMAEGTTRVHRRNIYRKLDIGSQAELFSLFIDVVSEGNIDGDDDPLRRYHQVRQRAG